ncbi:MAG: SsrA-binding protein SmpB [Phycisphaerales bacterium]|nr:SsrA-binding protein SmpB [Phycisphaerales bacterium]
MSKPPANETVCTNRKAGFRFEILEKIECGIALLGSEVKSIRDRNASIDEAYVRIDGEELWLIGAHIAPYTFANTQNHEPLRKRKLLVHKHEIRKLRPKVEQKGLTLVPMRIFFNTRGLAKVTIALARGKTLGDKRQTLKTREHKREMDRAMRRR